MKAIKILIGLFIVYAGIVAIFESLLGHFQPVSQSTMSITTTDNSGASNQRVLAKIESDGKLYAAANHWPRAWYKQALANPAVQITLDDETADYQAIPVTGAEHDRVNTEHALGTGFRILTGFPPRYFVRLEPR